MKPTALALLLTITPAAAQVLVPIGQARTVKGDTSADDGTTVHTNIATDAATDYGLFESPVGVHLSVGGVDALAAGYQRSEVLADRFVAEGTSSANATSLDGWDVDGFGESKARLEFRLDYPARYRVVGTIEGYDGGFGMYDLQTLSGTWINGEFGIAEGLIPVDDEGWLPAGTYSIEFRSYSNAHSSNGGHPGYGWAEYDFELQLTPFAGGYCVAAPNSAGAGATLSIEDVPSLAANDFHLRAAGLPPGQFGLAYYGPTQIQLPFGDGFRCVGGPAWRVGPPTTADAAGDWTRQLDFTSLPGPILPDSTWNFQVWYRDPSGPGGSGFNLSDAAWVTFVQ